MNHFQTKYLQRVNTQPFILMGFMILVGVICGLLVSHFEIYSILTLFTLPVAVIIFLKPYFGLLIIVTIFPFMVGYSEGVDILELTFIILFSIWIIGWLIRILLIHSGTKLNNHPLFKPSLALGILFIIASGIGFLNGASFIDVFRDASQFVGYLMIFPVASIIKNEKRAKKLLILMLTIGLPCWLWTSFIWWARKFGYEYGAMNIAGIGSAYFGPFLSALWPMVVLGKRRWIRLFAGIGLILTGVYSLGSGYRSQVIGFTCMSIISLLVLWTIPRSVRKLKTFPISFPVLLIGLVFFFWLYYGTLGYYPLPGGERTRQLYATLVDPTKLLEEDLSFQGRIIEAQAAFEVFKRNPILGQGLGHHLEMHWKYGKWYEFAYSQHIWHTAILSKFGAIGAFIFTWYIGSILIYLFNFIQKTKDTFPIAFLIGIFTWVAISLIPAIGSWEDRGFSATLGILLGILPYFRNAK